MPNSSFHSTEFTEQAEAMVLDNVSDEQFGVSELAEAMNMSRSNLLRKIKKDTQLSASQFIREVRLKKAVELLKQKSLTVSEISYQVGFGSSSYFIKCFREQFGYPPGEHGKHDETEEEEKPINPRKKFVPLVLIIGVVMIALSVYTHKGGKSSPTKQTLEKSIAVLPFKNESADSSNLYFVNGIMESTLSNLQKIEDLRVISRTSVEKYRNGAQTIPEMADELNVSYFVEGSGQKVGDQVLLNIQLIEAASDQPIWAAQYNREVVDIFALQNEIAQEIVKAIEVIVTPDELALIEKKPTENLVAYDYYLQALDPFYTRSHEGLNMAISLFEKAIEQDPEFALAYADIGISYFFLDMFKAEKQYTEQINNYADKALLYDNKLTEGLIAKAMYYMHAEEYRLALPHLEKALEYNPNSAVVVQMLSDFYARLIPNTAKYLEYALKGVQLNAVADDSVLISYNYLHLSNALVQNGFFEEAVFYIDKTLAYNPENYFGRYLKAFMLFARDMDTERTKDLLLIEWRKDTTRLDILQDAAKMYYVMEAYDSAYYYFSKFVEAREVRGLNIYANENGKIAWVYRQAGNEEGAAELFDAYTKYCEEDQSIYQNVNWAVKYAYEGKIDKAIEQLELFTAVEDYQYWFLLMDNDPMMAPLKANPKFGVIMQKIKDQFWDNHHKLRRSLEEKGLI